MAMYSPREIVSELDRYIIGQEEAKKAVAVALRNRWRRMQVDPHLRDEIVPKNILMVGPTGVGKTEISRRLAKLAKAPFVKVEATKFTEIGYVGRDVESIIRDLVEIAINNTRKEMRKSVTAKAELAAEDRVLEALVGLNASDDTKQKFRKLLRENQLNDREIEISVQVIAEESDKLLDNDQITKAAIDAVENDGIVFIDEIDKITGKSENTRGDVSREGVQRDLLPLIEGTTVSTKYGMVKTDHILFICSGAFHLAKPSDLLPELQGRLPIRVELKALTKEDFVRILTEPEANLIEQYTALLKTENFDLEFEKEAIEKIADIAVEINENVENIGARRLHTVMEILLEDISFTASDRSGQKEVITADFVEQKLQKFTQATDLSKFIL